MKLTPTREGEEERTLFAKEGLSTSTGMEIGRDGDGDVEDRDDGVRGGWKRTSPTLDDEFDWTNMPGLEGSIKSVGLRGRRRRNSE